MTLSLPAVVRDVDSQQNFERLAAQFPVDHVIVRKVAELPSSGETGELLFNEADNTMYYFNGTEWKT